MTNQSKSTKSGDDWMTSHWRPMMGMVYMTVCVFDFILAPVFWSLVQIAGAGEVSMQWNPLTLQGAGFFHIAMGAVLGISAYGRSQEKVSGVAGNRPKQSQCENEYNDSLL